MVITSFSNSTVKRLTELQNKSKARKREGLFITEGIRECKEVPQDRVEEIFISETFENSGVSDNIFKEMLDKQGYTVLSDEVFKKVSTAKTPQGILCTVRINNTNIEDITSVEEGFYLILENLQDPGNMGTIIRTAEGASVNGIIISKDSVDIYNTKVVSAAKGALFRMPCVISNDILMSVRYLKNKGIKTYAAHLKGKKYYTEMNYKSPTAFMIGNEGNGLTDMLANEADDLIIIPMAGKLESLNAGNAAAILMYECFRQRSFNKQ